MTKKGIKALDASFLSEGYGKGGSGKEGREEGNTPLEYAKSERVQFRRGKILAERAGPASVGGGAYWREKKSGRKGAEGCPK